MNQQDLNKTRFFKEKQFRLNLKSVIILLLALIFLHTLIGKLAGFQEVARLILKANKGYLLLATLAEFSSYVGAALLLGVILQRLGSKVAFWDRFRISSIGAFSIHFLPVGSFGEGAIDYYFLTRKGVPSGAVLLMLVLRIILCYAAFLSLFLLSLLLVPTLPHLAFSPRLVSGILFLLLLSGILYMIYLYRHKESFARLWQRWIQILNKMLRLIKKKEINASQKEKVFEEIYQGIGMFGRKKRFIVLALLPALWYWLGDMLCLFLVTLSFGFALPLGVLLFAYCVATLAGLISFIPGGLGVTEGTLGLALTALGVPFALALTAILVFRFFSFWLWIPIGFASFFTLNNNSRS